MAFSTDKRASHLPSSGRAGRLAIFIFACSAAFHGGCVGCRAKAPLQLVPKRALMVVEVPSLRRAAHGATQLITRVMPSGALSALLPSPKSLLSQALGFDPTSARELRKRGFNPGQGVSGYLTPEGRWGWILPASDAQIAEKTVHGLLKRLLGADETSTQEISSKSHKGKTLSFLKKGGKALAGWIALADHVVVVIGNGDQAVSEQHLLEALTPQEPISQNKRYVAAREALGKFAALVYVDGQALRRRLAGGLGRRAKLAARARAKALKRDQQVTDAALAPLQSVACSWQPDGRQTIVRAHIGLAQEGYQRLRKLLSGREDAISFSRYRPPKTWLMARLSVDPAKLLDWLIELLPMRTKRNLYRSLDRWEQRNGLRLREGVLSASAGRFALYLTPPPRDAKGVFFGGLLAAQVANKTKAVALLDRLERYLVLSHVPVRSRDIVGVKSFTARGIMGLLRIRWGVHEKALLVSAPKPFDAVVRSKKAEGLSQPRSKRARRALDADSALALYLDFGQLGQTLGGLSLPLSTKLYLAPVSAVLDSLDDLSVEGQLKRQGVFIEAVVRHRRR
jgi:hypothetical protein